MKLNGQIVRLNKDISLLQFLQDNKYDISIIAVALNGNIVPKATYADIVLEDVDLIEVVCFMGGG